MDREKVIEILELCTSDAPIDRCLDNRCPYFGGSCDRTCFDYLMKDALELLKAQEQRHRLEVHNIGNVDIPDGVTEAQFHAVMNNVVAALEHTDRGESWPYEEGSNDAE